MNQRRDNGFTLVELLIVIVIIAILAAITIVAYNGITNRAKTASGQSIAAQIIQKAVLYSSANSHDPSYYDLTTNTSGGSPVGSESKLTNTDQILDSNASGNNPLTAQLAQNGQRILYVTYVNNIGASCPDGPTTVTKIYVVYWDYSSNQQVAVPISANAPRGNLGTGAVPSGVTSSACA